MAKVHNNPPTPLPVANIFAPKPPGLTIGKEINRGAWGTVFEGDLDGQPVAVKKIHNALLEGAGAEGTTESVLEGFHRECVLLEKVDHRNVVKFYGAYFDHPTGEPILVMERMKENLRDYLKRKRGKISRQEAIEICLSIVRALHYLHSLPQPIVHHYLNVKNVMISKDGRVKIGDLWQSRLKEHDTVYFYSPGPEAIPFVPLESPKERAQYNEKIDTFSVGILMLEVATQHSPVVKPVDNEGVKDVDQCAADLSKLPEDHPLKPIVVQCLEDDPKKRPCTTRLYEHLNRLLMLFENCNKVRDNAERDEELPWDKITWISLGFFQEMCKPLPALDRSDEVQAMILTSCAEGNLEALRSVALESPQIIPLVMNKYGWTAVHFAAYNGHLNILKELLDTYHCDPNMKGKYKWTPVFVGARGGQMDIVKYLITEKQCFVSALTGDGGNILTAAARSGNAMLINWIMDVCQIEPVVNIFGESLLFPIARSGNIDIFDRMVERFGLRPDEWDAKKLRRPITCAAAYGHFSLVKHLFVKYNCDPRVKNKDEETLLHGAAIGGNIELVHWLVQEHGLDVHECAKDGQNALHFASFNGHLDIVKYLIPKFADRRFESTNLGNTCLHLSAQGGHLAVVKYLIEECGFDPGAGNRDGWTALHHASRYGHLHIVRELIEKMNFYVFATMQGDMNALHLAACGGHLDIVKYFIPKFADARFKPDNYGYTCLHWAAKEGHLALIKYLVEECGFDPGAGTKTGWTAFHLASRYGHLHVVRELIENMNVDVLATKQDGQNALHLAAIGGHLVIVKYLILKFADRRFESTNLGNTCLHWAAQDGHLAVVNFLIGECGFDPATENKNGWNALHCASRYGQLHIVRELIENTNVDVFATIKDGWNALHLAASGGHLDIVKYLIPKFADRRFESTNSGNTCLHLAAREGYLALFKYLIEECGFDPGTGNKGGWTPLHLAARCGHFCIVKELVEEMNVNIISTTAKGCNALHLAAIDGHLDIVQYLVPEFLNNEVDLNCDSRTYLHCAVEKGHLLVMDYLVERCGLDPSQSNQYGYNCLHIAIEEGHVHILERLVDDYGMDILQPTENGHSAVRIAAEHDHAAMVELLVDKYKCPPNEMDQDEEYPFLRAALNGSLSVVQVLSNKYKCSVHQRDKDGWNALLLAARYGKLQVVQELVEAMHADVLDTDLNGWNSLHLAVIGGHVDIVQLLVDKYNVDVHQATKSEGGFSAIRIAAEHGHKELVELLVDKYGCSLTKMDGDGGYPFTRAAFCGRLSVVQLLRDKYHCSSDQREGDGWTALHCASRYGHLPVVKELIEQMDANVLLTLPDGMNAFHLAACGGHLNIVKYLVAKFSERMYDLDTMGNTILHWAAKEGHLNVVKYLVEECGFYAGLGNMDEQNALHQAASGGFLDIVKYLIPNCINEMLNQTSRGNTCLHLAAQDGHLPVVKYLIGECGFDASLKNQGGKTALMIAMDKGHFDLIEYLTYQTRDGSGGFPDWVKRSKDVKVVSEMKKMSRLQWQTPQDALRSLFEDEDSDFESSALFIKHKPTEKTQEFMAQGVSSVLQPVSQGGSGDSQPPPTTAADLQGHESLLLDKCWIPFGIQTLQISKNGGVFPLEPASDDVTELNTNIFQIEIPKDAIKQERLVVKYAIIFAGPLLLPEGYKFASPVVYIYLDYTTLSKPVKLHVPHWVAGVDSLCTDDVPLFISPHVMPENDNMYVFTAVDAADVEVNMGFSTVRLSGHNSLLGQAMRICYKKQSRYYASLWERTGDSEHTFRVAVVYGVPAWIKVLRKYLPRTHWKMSKTVVPQIFKFVADRITGCLQEASGCGWQATLTPPVVLQTSIEFKEYSSHENMKEAIKEDLYPPSLYAIVVQHYAAEKYTVTKHMRMNISGTDLDPLLVPMRVMEVENQVQTASPPSQTSTSEPQDFASKAFMDKYRNEFLASVSAKAIAMKLRMQDILPITVYHCVEHTDSESAKNLLFLHFQEEGTVLTILSLCDIMISVTGYQKMNALGRDMKADLTSCRFSFK